MAEDRHNWISRMKQEGNEMADEVAKEATRLEELEEDFSLEHEWILTSKKTGQYVNWAALPKMYSEKKKQERTKRLLQPKTQGYPSLDKEREAWW